MIVPTTVHAAIVEQLNTFFQLNAKDKADFFNVSGRVKERCEGGLDL
jgi:hypothetical protein